MEYMDKKEAALKVAAQHHDFLDKATHEYIKLSGYADEKLKQKFDDMCSRCLKHYRLTCDEEITCEDIRSIADCIYLPEITWDDSFRAARKEMLDLLKGYLHPVGSKLREYQIFFGTTLFEYAEYPIVEPVWIRDKHITNLPKLLQETIHEYAMDAELDKYYLSKARKENEELRKQLAAAREAYKEIDDADDSHKRNKRVAQALGLSSGKKGNRQTTDHRQAYMRYVRLVRNEGKSREEALKIVQQEFPYNSIDAARKSLYAELRKVKDWWHKRDDLESVLYDLYEELGELNEIYQPGKKRAAILENYWKGLIPPKKS